MREASALDAPVIESARAALLETTPEDTIGDVTGVDESSDGVVDVHFANTLPGYPGWTWAVSVSLADGPEHPSVLELGLLPGEGALVAPEWVPWSDRLADYRAAQEAKESEDEAGLLTEEDELSDVEEEDLLADDEDELDGVEFEEASGEAGELGDEDSDDDYDDDDEPDDLDDDEDDELDDEDELGDDDDLEDQDELDDEDDLDEEDLDEGDDQDDVDADEDRDAGAGLGHDDRAAGEDSPWSPSERD